MPKIDGVTRTAYLSVRYLQETGREVMIFAPDTAVPSVGTSRVIPLPSVSMPGAEETRVALPNWIIAREMELFQPDMVLMFSPAIMSMNGVTMGRYLNIPVIGCYQTDLPGYTEHYGVPVLSRPVRSWLRYLHNGCHLTLVPTPKIQNELRAWGYKRLRVWGRGVDIETFSPVHRTHAMREKLLNGRDPDSLLCLYVGRLANEKCVHLLRELAGKPGIALTIIGDGQLREELETLFAGTGTYFTGYLVGKDLAEAFASADAFFFPGAQETFGQVVQEAMASGLPAVVTNRGGVSGLVEEGVTGFVVDHTAEAFAEAAVKLRDNPALRQQMAWTARELAEQRPWSAIMRQLEGHIREAWTMNERYKQLFGKTTYTMPSTLPLGWRR